MLQRHQRNNLDQLVAFARDELEQEFLTLKNSDLRLTTLSQTANTILDMYSNLSYPFIGLQVIKQNMTIIKHPHALQIQMILDKGQMFYLQSVRHDLTKLAQQQRIQQIAQEDITQYIQQINWKLGFDRQTILNESQQQIGDNIDLMKFFQGVRNYQNWQENLQKRTIQKLKKFAIHAENQLTLRKGFLISRLQNICEIYKRNFNQEFLAKLHKKTRVYSKLTIFSKINRRHERQSLQSILIASKSKNSREVLQNIFFQLTKKYNKANLMRDFRIFTKISKGLKNLRMILQNFIERKRIQNGVHLMKKIMKSKFKINQNFGRSFDKINKILKKYAVRKIIQNFGIKVSFVIKNLDQIYYKKMDSHFNALLKYGKDKIARKNIVSNRIKGKILLGLKKSNSKPLNLRKALLSWYMKGVQQKYAKKIYNIWLHGNTSKFTFLMRIKNMANQNKNEVIRQQLKVFLFIFMQRMNSYYNYCQKDALVKWKDRIKYCKKLVNFTKNLQNIVKKVQENQLKEAFDKTLQYSKLKKYLLKYLNKRIQLLQGKQKYSFDCWKAIPNIKRSQGQTKLLKFLRKKLNNLYNDQKSIMDIFKRNHVKGQQMKLKFVTKVFTKDLVYTVSFFNLWRRIIFTNKLNIQRVDEKNFIIKTNALKNIANMLKTTQRQKSKATIIKFLQRSQFYKKRHIFSLRVFGQIINKNQRIGLRNTLKQMQIQNQNGRIKKQKLVTNLVFANKMKLSQTIHIWKTMTYALEQKQKCKRVQQIFERLTYMQKKKLSQIFKTQYIFKFLQKYIKNYQINVLQSIHQLKMLPPRIQWPKRQNTIKFFNKINFIINKGKTETYQKFKQSYQNGSIKKKNMLNFLHIKILESKKINLNNFINNLNKLISQQRSRSAIIVFSHLFDVSRQNMQYIFLGESLWKKKAQAISKFDNLANLKLQQALKFWHNISKNLSFYQQIKNEKKKRFLCLLSDLYTKNQDINTKKMILAFDKNSTIIQLQINFLKKLCDGQAGKALKAIMIWKTLPKAKNKHLVAKATKFQKNLHGLVNRIIKSTLIKFKDDHYYGNDSKKQFVRKLVAKNCTGISKYFEIWKKNNKLITIFSRCHKVQQMGQILDETAFNNLKLLFSGNKTIKVQKTFTNIKKWWNKHKLRIFNSWRNQTKNQIRKQALKQKSIIQITKIERKNEYNKIRAVLQKLKRQYILKSVIQKYFIKRVKANIIQSIKNIKNIPDRLKIAKNNQKIRSVIKMFTKLQVEVQSDKKKLLDLFKQINYKGTNKKLNACTRMMRDKIAQVQKCIHIWLNMFRAEKMKQKQIIIQKTFSSTFELYKASLAIVFQNVKQSKIKKQSLDKMFKALQIKRKGMFGIWRSKVKQIKMNQVLNNVNKKTMLQKLNKIVSGTSNETVKKSIKNFYLNFKITKVQVSFINKLLQTKSGKVMQAYRKWKSIPNQNMMQKYKKGQKFYFKLQGLLKHKLKETHSNFQKNNDEGSTLKKQSVLQLLQITSAGMRRYYNRWIRLAKKDQILKQANATMHSFDYLQQGMTTVFKILFEDQRTTRIKTWALEKMFNASQSNTETYFKMWKQNVRKMKIMQDISDKQKKTALVMFSKVLGGSERLEIQKIIQKFNKNVSITNISKNFLNKLLKTKSGKVFQLFSLWRSIPDVKLAKKKKKAIKFQSQLNKFAGKLLKITYQPFKTYSNNAQNKKRICIERMIRASMGEHKKKFIIWRQIVKEQKMLHHTQLFDKMFEKFNLNITNFLSIMFKNSAEEVSKKKNLCRRLINNASFVQHHAYFIWKQALQNDNIKIEKQQGKVKSNLINLININEKVEIKKLIQIISLFKKQMSVRNRVAAEIFKDQKNKKAISFYKNIQNFSINKIGTFFKIISSQHVQMCFINKSNALLNSFESMFSIAQQNLTIVMQSNKQTLIKQKALNKMFNNMNLSTQRAFNLWRQYKNVLALQSVMTREKKKNVLQILNRALQNNQKIVIPNIIAKFEKNYKTTKIMRELLIKILKNKGGKVPLAFMVWKSLPNPDAKKIKQKGMKFESGLARLINRKIRTTYDKFKDNTYEGNNKKRYICKKLVLLSMSDSNKYFNKWRKINNQSKITQKIKCLSQIFEGTTNVVKTNLLIFDKSHDQHLVRENLIKKFLENTTKNLQWSIRAWRDTLKDQKCYLTQKILQKYIPENFNNRVLKQAFLKIKIKSESQTLRTYINSLWKWKMSNVQANYYSKFIKVFKESEQLLILSSILNKRHNDNLHHAFKSILTQGNRRHALKYRVTQKYLTRKLNNYFQRFKLGACIQQAKTWRNMYKETVKGKKLIDLIEQYTRKQLYNSVKIIEYCVNKQKSGIKFEEKLSKIDLMRLRDAFDKISQAGIQRFHDKVFGVYDDVTWKFQTQSFHLIKQTAYISKLKQKILKVSQKLMKKYGYARILYKSNLAVRSKLSLNFISYILEQKQLKNIQQAIGCINKNNKKTQALSNISNLMNKKIISHEKQFYQIIQDYREKKKFLNRFKKGLTIKKILDKQEKKTLVRYFQLMKKKQNRWIIDSIRRFMVRSNVKSTMAVSLWRLRNYESAIVQNQ